MGFSKLEGREAVGLHLNHCAVVALESSELYWRDVPAFCEQVWKKNESNISLRVETLRGVAPGDPILPGSGRLKLRTGSNIKEHRKGLCVSEDMCSGDDEAVRDEISTRAFGRAAC